MLQEARAAHLVHCMASRERPELDELDGLFGPVLLSTPRLCFELSEYYGKIVVTALTPLDQTPSALERFQNTSPARSIRFPGLTMSF